jgi:hypothetical protein
VSNRIISGIVLVASVFSTAEGLGQSRTPSLQLKAFERIILNGVAPTPEINVGDEEIKKNAMPVQSEFFIYIIANRVSNLKLEQIWIKQELYTATISRVTSKPVLLKDGKHTDTLVHNTKEAVWQISLTGKDLTGIQPKKNMAIQVAANELVLRMSDKNGAIYNRTVKKFSQLKPFAGM